MKADAQKIAIAESRGWKSIRMSKPWEVSDNPEERVVLCGCIWAVTAKIPDYHEDLNAILAAVRDLPSDSQWGCFTYLAEIVDPSIPAATATAAQWCEAYLKTIGRWEADK